MLVRRMVLVVALVVASASSAHALELKNDGFVSNGQAVFQTGFVADEAGAVRFVAPAAGRQLLKIQLLFGGATTMQTLTVKVFDDSAGTDTPGNEIYMGDVALTGSDSAMQELDLAAANVFVPAQFRVAFYFTHAGAPSIANDSDGNIMADKNFIFAAGAGWKKSSALGLTGDWVIRAFVTDAPDAGTGSFCDTNAECGNGRYCDAPHHACTFDCQDDTDCPGGGHCDDLGQCGAGSSDDGGCSTSDGGRALGVMLVIALVLASRRPKKSR